MTQEIAMRPARREDCDRIAQLYSIASDGVADYIWTKLAKPGEDIFEVGRRRYAREDTPFSYQNCTVAELDGQVIGMLVAFPMHVDPLNEEPDPVLAPYAVLEADDSYYTCGVAVLPEYQGHGIGSQLMELAEVQARERGFSEVSLVVFEQNTGAKRLYDRLGYVEVAREPVYPHPLIRHTGDALLMVKRI